MSETRLIQNKIKLTVIYIDKCSLKANYYLAIAQFLSHWRHTSNGSMHRALIVHEKHNYQHTYTPNHRVWCWSLQVRGHFRSTASLWDRSQLNPTSTCRISLILTLGFVSALCNIKDILLIVGFLLMEETSDRIAAYLVIH